jgi:hypothetical protein
MLYHRLFLSREYLNRYRILPEQNYPDHSPDLQSIRLISNRTMLIIVTTFTGVFPENMPTTRIFVLLCMAFTLRAKGQYEYMDGFTIDYKNRHDKIIEIQGTFGIGNYSVGFRRLNMFRIDLEKQWYWGIGLRLNAGYSVGGNFLTAN